MKQFNKITIIGVGLIGGSIGLAIKKKRLAKEVVGVFRRELTLHKALKRKAVDKGARSIQEGVTGADMVIIATPVLAIPAMAKEAARYAKKGAIITDAGSTKRWIIDKVEKEIGRANSAYFVGSHPMAGSEHAGVEYAKADLFEGSPCIVTKTKKTDKKALAKIVGFWKALGARVEVMSPEDHDKNVAFISHLPHIIAFSLAGSVPEETLAYGAEGFKDTTRVALSEPSLWADIFLSNREAILRSGRQFEIYYKKVMAALAKGDYDKVVALLGRARENRSKFKR